MAGGHLKVTDANLSRIFGQEATSIRMELQSFRNISDGLISTGGCDRAETDRTGSRDSDARRDIDTNGSDKRWDLEAGS